MQLNTEKNIVVSKILYNLIFVILTIVLIKMCELHVSTLYYYLELRNFVPLLPRIHENNDIHYCTCSCLFSIKIEMYLPTFISVALLRLTFICKYFFCFCYFIHFNCISHKTCLKNIKFVENHDYNKLILFTVQRMYKVVYYVQSIFTAVNCIIMDK